jgi:hypothetical protein
LQASGRLSEWWTLLKRFTLHSFLLWVFSIRFSHTKFLTRQWLIQAYALSHVFPTGVFLEIISRHWLFLESHGFMIE